MANEVVSELRLELDQFRQDLKDASEAARKAGEDGGKNVGDGIEGGLSKMGGTLLKTAAGFAVAFAGAFALKHLVDAGTEASETVRRLDFALQATGQYTPELSAHMVQFAENLHEVAHASTDAVIQGETLLTQMTKLRGDGLEKATKAAVDLAAGMNIDLGSAFQLVERAANGHITQLKRMGFDLKETGDKALDFAQALNAISVFQGAAEARSHTFVGALERIEYASKSMVKTVGQAIVDSPVVTGIMNLIAEAKEKTAKAFKEFFGQGDVIGDMILKLLDFAVAITDYVVPPLELFYNIGKIVFMGVSEAVALVYGGILKLGEGLGYVLSKLPGLSEVGTSLKAMMEDLAAANDETIQKLMGDTDQAISDIYNFSGTDAAKKYAEQLRANVQQAAEDAENSTFVATKSVQNMIDGVSWASVATQMSAFENKIKVSATNIAQILNQNIVAGFSNSFAAVGGALVKGENAFAAFGKSILKALGQVLIQFGSMLIAIGVGLSTVPFLFGLQGPAAIAAGIAATILGGALMALGGGGDAGPAASGGGGGVASGNSPGIAPAFDAGQQQAQIQNKEPQTAVHVTIQGNVLDRRETGLAIADVINEVFGSNGVTFATGNA